MPRQTTHIRLTTTLALLLALVGTTAAQARMRGDFDAADANHDGRVTLQEFQTYAGNALMAADGRIARKFQKMSPQDQAARLQKRFDKKDRGHKGYLDRNDWND